jgi:hypothetical protein
MPDRPELTYRSRMFAILGWATLAIVVTVVASVVLATPEPTSVSIPVAVGAGAAVGWLAYRCYIAPRVVVTDRGVRVVNPFTTRELRWWDIERFEARPMLTIIRRDGSKVTAWAVQNAVTARLVGRTSQGEEVTAALTRQLAAATMPPPPPI